MAGRWSISFVSTRNRTPSKYVLYGLYLYFSGSSLRRVSERLSCFIRRKPCLHLELGSKYHPKKISSRKMKILEFIVDETIIKVGSENIWLWIAIEPKNKEILSLTISMERNMLMAETFLSGVVKIHRKHPVSTDGGGTWYPMACRFLKLKHHIHSPYEKSLIERTMQYIKYRTGCFDDCFPCRKKTCNLKHVRNWLNLFVDHHNSELYAAK